MLRFLVYWVPHPAIPQVVLRRYGRKEVHKLQRRFSYIVNPRSFSPYYLARLADSLATAGKVTLVDPSNGNNETSSVLESARAAFPIPEAIMGCESRTQPCITLDKMTSVTPSTPD